MNSAVFQPCLVAMPGGKGTSHPCAPEPRHTVAQLVSVSAGESHGLHVVVDFFRPNYLPLGDLLQLPGF